VEELGFRNFILFKSLFAGLLGGVLTPVIALAALGDVTPTRGVDDGPDPHSE